MSSSSSDMVLIDYLKNVLSQINFYFGMFIFWFGIIGNILNILVLSQRPLRSNPCVIIFLGSSTAGMITILSGLTSRVISGVSTDLSGTINWICKFRGFLVFTSRSITFWLIMLATIDRWLVSCIDVRRRRMSSKKNSFRGIIMITIVSILIHSQLFYCYQANLIDTPLKCFTKNIGCRLMNDLTFAIISILCPLILTAIFGWMTILNIRISRRCISIRAVSIIGINYPIQTNPQQRQSKKTDQRLLVMLFVQVIFIALLTLPFAIEKVYATLTTDKAKSALQLTIEDFIYQVALIGTFLAVGMPFYLNTLSGGNVFRKAIFTLKQSIIRKILCR